MKKTMVSLLLCCSFTFVGCGGDNTQKQIDELSAKIEQLQSDATVSQATIEELQNQTASQKQQIEDLQAENASQKQQIEELEKDNLLWQDHVLDGYGMRTDYKELYNVNLGPLPWPMAFRLDYRRRTRSIYVDDVTVAEVDLKVNYTNNNGHCRDFPFYDGEKEVVGWRIQLIVFKAGAINNLGKIVDPELVHVIREIPSEEFFSDAYRVEHIPISDHEMFVKYNHIETIKIPSKLFERAYYSQKYLYIGLSSFKIYSDGMHSDKQVDYGFRSLYYLTYEYNAEGDIIYDGSDYTYRKIILSEKGFD